MIFRVLEAFNFEAPEGVIALSPGQAIKLSEDEAIPLYGEGVIKLVGCRIYSEVLQEFLWICHTIEDRDLLTAQGTTEVIYTGDEIRKLKGMCKKGLKTIHAVKEVFPMAIVEEVRITE